MTLRNLYLGLKDQLPLSRFWRNLKGGHIQRKFKIRSHLREDGTPKVAYSTQEKAIKVATKMQQKHGRRFSYYKCFHCDGYHLGGNRE
jgi:hypothetical protein